MTYTYEIAATDGIETTNEPFPKKRVREVEQAFQDALGEDIDLIGRMSVPNHVDVYGKSDVGATLQMSDQANEMVRFAFGFFSIKEDLDDYFGRSRGPANVVGQYIERDLTVENVIVTLANNGDLQRAVNVIHNVRLPSDPPVMVILGYAFVKYSLGWDAERILDERDDFKKGNTAQDEGGIDGTFKGRMVQIKPGTEVPSKGANRLGSKERDHMFYLWDMDGGMRLADAAEYNEMKHELAAENGLAGSREGYRSAATIIDRSDDLSGNEMDRPFRFFWW